MPQNKTQKQGSGKKRDNKNKTGQVVRVARVPNPVMSQMAAYDRMLRDPCGAPMTQPPYGGMSSGYLTRTTDFFTVVDATRTGLTVGSTYKMSGFFSVCPRVATSTYGICTGATSTPSTVLPALTRGGWNNWVVVNAYTASGCIESFRAVAGCLKWEPSGAYTARSGIVGPFVNTGDFTPTGAPTMLSLLRQSNQTAPNGSKVHEIRWMPNSADEEWVWGNQTSPDGQGMSIGIMLVDVDGTATSATSITANGFIEATFCWQWTPSGEAGLTPSLAAPAPFTSQQFQSSIKDMGAYVYDGVRASARDLGYAAGAAAATAGAQILTGGIRSIRRRNGRNNFSMLEL